MICTRVVKSVGQIGSRSGLLRRNAVPHIFGNSRNNESTSLNTKKNINLDEDDSDKPIKYSTSEAAKWLAARSRAPEDDMLWYQPYVVSGSLAVFLIYFTMLREENDIDLLFDNTLPEEIYKPQKQTSQDVKK